MIEWHNLDNDTGTSQTTAKQRVVNKLKAIKNAIPTEIAWF